MRSQTLSETHSQTPSKTCSQSMLEMRSQTPSEARGQSILAQAPPREFCDGAKRHIRVSQFHPGGSPDPDL